jgi:N-acetylmuramoyl-L-alanine amidase
MRPSLRAFKFSLCFFATTLCRAFWIFGAETAETGSGAGDSKQRWHVVVMDDRGYVSIDNLNEFYEFERFERNGDNWKLLHPNISLSGTIGSHEIHINDILYELSFPIAEKGGLAMFSTVDLAKLIEPVIRPRHIKTPTAFHRVVIDPGPPPPEDADDPDHPLALAERLKVALGQEGFATELAREAGSRPTLAERLEIANRDDRTLVIAFAFSRRADLEERGVLTSVLAPQGTRSGNSAADEPMESEPSAGNAKDAENIALATAIHSCLVISGREFEGFDLGVRRSHAELLKGLAVPGAHIEFAFPTGGDSQPFDADIFFDEISTKVVEGVLRYQIAVGVLEE